MAMRPRKEDLIKLLNGKLWCSECDKPVDKLIHEEDFLTNRNMWLAQCHGERVGCSLDKGIDYSSAVKTYINFPGKIERQKCLDSAKNL